MSSRLPQKRKGLLVRAGHQSSPYGYRIQHAEIPRPVYLEERSYLILSLLDGERSSSQILEEAYRRFGIDIAPTELGSFVEKMEGAGLLAPRPSAEEAVAEEQRVRGRGLLEEGDRKGALRMFRESLQIDPGNSAALFDLGILLILEERYSDSLPCFEALVKKHPQDRLLKSYAGHLRSAVIEKKPVYVHRTAHLTFVDHRPPGNPSFLDEAFGQGEAILDRVASLCGRTAEGTALVCLSRRWSPPYIEFPPHNLQALMTLRKGHLASSLFAHECVHLAVNQNCNRFLAEGLAVYCQYEWFERQPWPFPEGPLPRMLAAYSGPLIPLEKLLEASSGSPNYFSRKPPFYVRTARQYVSLLLTFVGMRGIFCDKILAYLQVGGFVKYLIETYGRDSFRETLERMEDPYQARRFQEVFSSVYGMELAGLEDDWLRWVKGHRP